MARVKTANPQLPKHVTIERGIYYFRVGKAPRVKLGSNYTDAMRELARVTRVPGSTKTMGDVMDRYIVDVLPTKAPATQATNISEIKLLRAAFGEMAPTDITAADVYAYMDNRPSVRANREKALLSHIFKKAIRWGAAATNPCRDVESNPEFRRTRLPSDDELAAFSAMCPRWLQLYIELKYMTGLRMSDLLGLTRHKLTDDGIALVLSKSRRFNPQTQKREGQEVVIAWTQDLRAVVDEILALQGGVKHTHLFVSGNHTPYNKSSFHSVWQDRMEKFCAGDESKRFHEHDIRAVTASDDEDGAQKRLGHKQKATTDIYIRSKASRTVTPLRPKFSGAK